MEMIINKEIEDDKLIALAIFEVQMYEEIKSDYRR